mmetsp:Transcript_39777/g.93170  ORF Transcript_39777/g.93170 Transcript_39777/m.93170 type:complete len:228 (-) Transcript_39777:358-1041(-)
MASARRLKPPGARSTRPYRTIARPTLWLPEWESYVSISPWHSKERDRTRRPRSSSRDCDEEGRAAPASSTPGDTSAGTCATAREPSSTSTAARATCSPWPSPPPRTSSPRTASWRSSAWPPAAPSGCSRRCCPRRWRSTGSTPSPGCRRRGGTSRRGATAPGGTFRRTWRGTCTFTRGCSRIRYRRFCRGPWGRGGRWRSRTSTAICTAARAIFWRSSTAGSCRGRC